MKIKISPAVQLSIGLVLLTVSILLVAQALGLTPGISSDERLFVRQKLAETIALQSTIALKRNDRQFVQSMFNQITRETPSIQSIGLRRSDSTIAYQTSLHENLWTLASGAPSTATQIQIPIFIDGKKQAFLEITFIRLQGELDTLLGIPKFIWLIVFICCSSFVAFSFYLRRSLKHLDPSSVVPARVRNALNTMVEGVIILDKRHQIILANDAFSNRFNIEEKLLVGRKIETIDVELENNNEGDMFPWQMAKNTGLKQMKIRMHSEIDSENVTFNVNSVPILDDKNRCQGTINSFDDITEIESKSRMLQEMLEHLSAKQKAIEKKNKELNYLATRDPLTDCYNRRYLFESLDKHFAKRDALQREFCVVMLDIDYFKRINDTHGHNVGDVVIKEVCKRAQSVLSKDDVIARFGGEEFCVLLKETTPERAMLLAEKCRAIIARDSVEGVPVAASFGVSSLVYGAETPNELILQADQALYASKDKGRNQVTLWSKSLATEIVNDSQARTN